MKRFLIGLLTYCGTLDVLSVLAGEPSIRVSVSVDKERAFLGEQLRPSIEVVGDSESAVTILKPEYAILTGDLSVTLLGPNGESLKLTIYPPAPLIPKPKDYIRIGKGDRLGWTLPDIVERYGVSQPGKYELQVRYRVEVNGQFVIVEAQKLTVEFLPQKKANGEN